MKGDEQQSNNHGSHDIERIFMNNFWEEIEKFYIDETDEDAKICDETRKGSSDETKEQTELLVSMSNDANVADNQSLVLTDLLGEMDALLSMAFEKYATNTTTTHDDNRRSVEDNEEPIDCYKLYEK